MPARSKPWSCLGALSLTCSAVFACNPESDGGNSSEPAPSESSSAVVTAAPPDSSPSASATDTAPVNTAPEMTASATSSSATTPTPTDTLGAGGNGGASTLPTATASGGQAGLPAGAAGTSSSAGGASADAGADPCALPEYIEPTVLSETGLYTDMTTQALSPGVREYKPRFELWSDGAAKRRFVYLPPCSQIDTEDPDYWSYPQGTKLWKEFARNNEAGELIRVETRLLQKYTQTKWFMTAFIWNAEQSEASIAEGDGPTNSIAQENASGTPHDVPGQKSCETCHYSMLDKVLGFGALQLDFESEPGFVTLEALATENLLTHPITTPITLPGTEAQQAALGYMHANCGTCHNPWAKDAGLMMQYWLEIGTLGALETTNTYLTTVGQITQAPQQPAEQPAVRIVPQDPEASAVYWRMTQPPTFPTAPEGGNHMPLIGTEITDETGLQLVVDWINSLPVQE